MQKQRRALVANIRKFWDSTDTHLDYCIKRNAAREGSRKFHTDTVIEYLEDMLKAARALR